MQFAILGNPGNRRVRYFARAVLEAGLPHPIVLSWRDYLAGRVDLRRSLPEGSFLRIDSPGEDQMVDLLLLERAGLKLRMGDIAWGEIRHGKPWFQAFSGVLAELEARLDELPLRGVCNSPGAIRTMYDKWRTHDLLFRAGVPQAHLLGKVEGFDHLLAMMDESGMSRVFLKPFYGSSASGVVAFRRQGGAFSATTSVEMQGHGSGQRLFNSLRVRNYRDRKEIGRMVDQLAGDDLLAEEWVPKIGFQGAVVDLRVVVVVGKARHAVLRSSQSPLTNLHLGNARGDLAAFREEVGEDRWGDYLRLAEKATAAVKGACYAGVDLLIGTDPSLCCVGELNAFGDLIPGVLHEGQSTCAAFVEAFRD